MALVPDTNRFHIQVEGALTLRGYGALDVVDFPVSVQGEVEFTELIVVPENLFPKPISPAEARHALSPFIGLEDFGPVAWDRFRHVLSPQRSEA